MTAVTRGKFSKLPQSRLGWWAVVFAAIFTLLFIGVTSEIIRFSGFLIMSLGVIAGILLLVAIIWKKERSWLVWLMLIPGLFAILFALGEVLVPH